MLRGVISAALVMPLPANAAWANVQVPVASSTAPWAGPECELHFWPTRDGVANVLGMASVALPLGFLIDGAGHAHTDRAMGATMIEKIAPETQAQAAERADVIAALRLPAATRVIVEQTLPAYQELEKDAVAKERIAHISVAVDTGARLTDSQSRCYAELMVSGIAYARSPLDPPVLAVRWIYRRWGDGKPTQISWHRHRLPTELASDDRLRAAPKEVMENLFATNLIEWAHKKLK